MGKCKNCGQESSYRKVCTSCLGDWSAMRKTAFDYLQEKHGKMCPENLKTLQAEIKKLEKIWKKSPEEFQEAIK